MTAFGTLSEVSAAARLRRWLWRHPEAPFAVVAATAAITLLTLHAAEAPVAAHHHAAHAPRWSFDVMHWWLMVIGIMVPGLFPMVRRIAFDSLWKRRYLNGVVFVATYTVVWGALGMVGAGLVEVFEATRQIAFEPGRVALGGCLVVAAIWQFSPARRRALNRFHLVSAVAPRGRRATLDLTRLGLTHARACVIASGPMMLVMFMSNNLLLMAPLGAVMLRERYQERPRPELGAAVLGWLALLVFTIG